MQLCCSKWNTPKRWRMIVRAGALLNFGEKMCWNVSMKEPVHQTCTKPSIAMFLAQLFTNIIQICCSNNLGIVWQCKQTQVLKDESFDQYVLQSSQFYVLKSATCPLNNKTTSAVLVVNIGSMLRASMLWGQQLWRGKLLFHQTMLLTHLCSLRRKDCLEIS